MSYSSSIPQASDPRAQSQGQINSNFQAINSVWAVNHAPLTGTATQGQHDVLTIRPQTGDPTTAANQVALYNKLVSTIPELFFRPKSNGTPIQLTAGTINAGTGGTQQSFIAGPFLIYCGFIASPTNGQTVTLLPSSTLKYVNINQLSASGTFPIKSVAATSISGNTFVISYAVSGVTIPYIYYFAIGQ